MEFEIKDYNNYNHEDILVYPEYQRNGIGTALLQKILDEYKNVYQKHLLTDNTEKTISFYNPLDL